MKKTFLTLTVWLLVAVALPVQAGAGTRCADCRERRAEERKTLSIILSGIAQLANGLAAMFGNPNNDMARNEGVCNFVAGVCTVAAQASRSYGQESNPTDIYHMLSQPEAIAAIKKILEDEALFASVLVSCDHAQDVPAQDTLEVIQVNEEPK